MFVKVESAGMSLCVCPRGFQGIWERLKGFLMGELQSILSQEDKQCWKNVCTELRMHITSSHLKMKEQLFRERLVLPGNGLHHLSWMLCWARVHFHLSAHKNVILPLLHPEQPQFSQLSPQRDSLFYFVTLLQQ